MIVRRRATEAIAFGGLRIFDYTAGKSCSSSLAVIEVPPGVPHAKSWSTRSDKYYLVTAGSVRFVLENQITDLDTGDFCLVPQGKRFSYSNVGSSLAVLVLVHTPSFELNAEVFEVGTLRH
jgi:mannose-6-phosphate isomerase-like protein (cupin superfamily)